MEFFRALGPIAALSFDLDDTLYDNGPVIEQAEAWMVAHMRDAYLQTAMCDRAWWQAQKQQLWREQPALKHDVSLCRRRLLARGLEWGGMAAAEAAHEADKVFTQFLEIRSRVEVPDATRQVLAALAERFPLVVITNGNVLLERLGLDHHFQHVLKAGGGFAMKPAPDLFAQMADRLGLPPARILHVGDDVTTDVLGALHNGYRSAWLNDRGRSLQALRRLPDLMLNRLDELLNLI
ncbi:HAD-IA family hydrolase [Pseudaeromonas paramecii]|uniref:HAD-IA family hydrolase n=1 Tax=Pseudaeromonas paramecii TaxID=2138166 RepID=A0ABP8Q041_9GAMM